MGVQGNGNEKQQVKHPSLSLIGGVLRSISELAAPK